MKSLLKWVGSKARNAADIADRIGRLDDSVYVEPFFGGGSVYFEMFERGNLPRGALLMDANRRLVNFWQVVQQCPEELISELDAMSPHCGDDWGEHYGAYRDELNQDCDLEDIYGSARAAAVFLWLNKTCFNGLYRENSKGEFNVPPGRYKKPSLPSGDDIMKSSEALGHAVIAFPPFQDLVSKRLNGCTVYADPPYIGHGCFSGYVGGSKFGIEETRLLEVWLSDAALVDGAKSYVSNHDVPEVHAIFASDRWRTADKFDVTRNVNSKKTARGAVSEVLLESR